MKRILLAIALGSTSAHAAVDQATLDTVAFDPRPGAQLPLDAPVNANGRLSTLRNVLNGKPALLLPIDFHCRTTCGPALSIVADALERLQFVPGAEFRLLLLGLNTSISPAESETFVSTRVASTNLTSSITRLTASPEVLGEFTTGLGYRYSFDPSTQSFAHPIGAVALTSEGTVARLLSPLALDPDNLRLALLEAGQGTIGSWTTRLTLLCYGFDPAHGIYTSRIAMILRALGSTFLITLAFWLTWLVRRSRGTMGKLP